ncbi:MAG: C39 family peptidase [Lachnospiraceae bacterium]|nr:C39 family peptidase [Lachnospiraceae bacterium]
MRLTGLFGAIALSIALTTSQETIATINNAPVNVGVQFSRESTWKDIGNVEIEEFEAKTGYIKANLNLRSIPDASGELLRVIPKGTEVKVVGFVKKNPFNKNTYYISEDGGYIHSGYFTFDKAELTKSEPAAAAQPSDPGVQLPVNNILQNPELPNGCEITSLSIVLNYKGYAVDKCDMSDNYLPKWPDLSGDPEYYYLREPRSNGFYCFATCLCTTIDNYNAANGTAIQYKNLTGLTASDLYAEIDAGNPVVVWGTLKWRTPNKYKNGLYSNLHCMVLAGYTDTTVTIIDPIYGNKLKTIKRSTFESVWTQMGSRAMTVTQ